MKQDDELCDICGLHGNGYDCSFVAGQMSAPKSEKQKVEELLKEFDPVEERMIKPDVCPSEALDKLHQDYLKWERFARAACNLMLEAELEFRDTEREREEAWERYNNEAKNPR